MFFFNNQNLNFKDIDNDCYYRNDIETLKKKTLLINKENYSYYHLCKSYILYKNQYNLYLILSFDAKKNSTFFNYFLKIYYIDTEELENCNQKYCISYLCNNEYHFDIKKSKLIYVINKTNLSDLNIFPKIIQDLKKCYQCSSIWNFHSDIRLIEDKNNYEYDKCDNCKIKEHIDFNTLQYITKCVICLDNVYKKDHIKTLCKHSFHKYCIDNWLKNNNKCPLCRTIIRNENNNNDDDFILSI